MMDTDNRVKLNVAFILACLFHLLIIVFFLSLPAETKTLVAPQVMLATLVDVVPVTKSDLSGFKNLTGLATPLSEKENLRLAKLERTRLLAQIAQARQIALQQKVLQQRLLAQQATMQTSKNPATTITLPQKDLPGFKNLAGLTHAEWLKKVAEVQQQKLAASAQKLPAVVAKQPLNSKPLSVQPTLSPSVKPPKSSTAPLLEQFVSAMLQKINQHWHPPLPLKKGLFCTMKVTLSPQGVVQKVLAVLPCSEDALFKQSLISAVNQSSPLPVANYQTLFAEKPRTFTVMFRPG